MKTTNTHRSIYTTGRFLLLSAMIHCLIVVYNYLKQYFNEYSSSQEEFQLLFRREWKKSVEKAKRYSWDIKKQLEVIVNACKRCVDFRKSGLEREWRLALRRGEETAWKRFNIDCYPIVLKLVIESNLERENAKDIFQEVLLIMVERFSNKTFYLDAKVTTFVYAIARNKVLKVVAKKKNYQVVAPEDSSAKNLLRDAEVQLFQDVQMTDELQDFWNALDEESSTLLKLKYIHKKRPTSICKQLSITETYLQARIESLKDEVYRLLDVKIHSIMTHKLAALDVMDREIITRKIYKKQSHKEIGVALDLTEKTSRVRLNRALKRLNEQVMIALLNQKK